MIRGHPSFHSIYYMSVSSRTASPSPDNFTAIFDSAWSEYEKVTGKRLNAHPLTAQLDSCDSPKAVLNILRIQAQVFGKERRGDEKLMDWLGPTVNILFVFSSMLVEGIGLVSTLILPLTIPRLTNTLGFPARQSNLCWYRCSSRDREGCRGELRYPRQRLRANPLLLATSDKLRWRSAHRRIDRAAWEDYGAVTFSPRSLD